MKTEHGWWRRAVGKSIGEEPGGGRCGKIQAGDTQHAEMKTEDPNHRRRAPWRRAHDGLSGRPKTEWWRASERAARNPSTRKKNGGAQLSHVETSSTRLHKATRPNRKETRRVEEEDTQQKRWRASEDNEDVNPSALYASRPTGGANPQHEGKTSTLGNRFRKNCGRRRASPRVKTIEASVRDSDVAAHFGGDETQP
jgi:hypothetical protein